MGKRAVVKIATRKPSEKRKAFAREYLVDKNATKAAIRVGYSAKTAGAAGNRLLKDVEVQAEIQAGLEKMSENTRITAERVLTELAKIAFFDSRRLFRPDGTMKAITELDDDEAAALAGFDVVENTSGEGPPVVTKKIKLLDRNGAIEKVMRHLGMFNDKQTHRHEFEGLTQEELDARIAALSAKK